jgi:hypothetical protein
MTAAPPGHSGAGLLHEKGPAATGGRGEAGGLPVWHPAYRFVVFRPNQRA